MALPRRMGLVSLMGVALALAPAPAFAFSFGDLWPFGEKKSEPPPVQDPTPYEVRIDVDDASLKSALTDGSALVDKKGEPPSGVAGLIARAKADRDTLTGILYEKARYGGTIVVTINDKPLDTLNAFSNIGRLPASVHVRVISGREFTFGQVRAANAPGKGVDLPDIGFATGKSASSKTILSAESRLLAAWRDQGYPLASVGERNVVADHKSNRVDVSLVITPGPRAPIGTVSTAGEQAVHRQLIIDRAGLKPGEEFHPQKLKDAEAKLRALSVFEGVRVTIAERLDSEGRIPVLITVQERKPRVIGASVSYSNTEGAAFETYWMHRNLFGGAESLRVGAGLSRIGMSSKDGPDYKVTARFRKPAVITPNTDFTMGVIGEKETTSAYKRIGAGFDIGFEHMFSKHLTGTIAYEIERSQIETIAGKRDYLLTGLNSSLSYDTRDNTLDPTEGYRILLRARPTYDLIHKEAFASFRLDASTYYALDDKRRFVLAGRVAVGSLTARDINYVPPDRRFYAGGGGSIRGFSYQGLGPRDAAGNLTGGRSLLELSAELRVKATDTLGFALFADAGNAYSSIFPTGKDMKMSVGAGLRYLTPIGPFRLDFAVPVKRDQYDPKFGVYVGLGQAF